MIGAIVGDIAGSRFEFNNHKSKDFDLFVVCKPFDKFTRETMAAALDSSTYSDDSVMTLAVAKAIMLWKESGKATYEELSRLAIESMREFGRKYPLAGYGGTFKDAIRNAISIGGDSDTIGAICGAVAGAFYGVPDDIRAKAETFLSQHLLDVLHDFERVHS